MSVKGYEMLGLRVLGFGEIPICIWRTSGHQGYKNQAWPKNCTYIYVEGVPGKCYLAHPYLRPHMLRMFRSISMTCPRNAETTKACSLLLKQL